MPFVGRDRELHVAANLIGSGSGSAGLFVGESGSGKSALAREVAARHDAVVVTASPSERMWPLSGVTAVVAALDDGRRDAVDSVLSRSGDWPEHLLAEEISRTLHLLRADPCVVVVDDLDEMDSASITVLSYVFGRLRGTGVSVIATSGSFEGRHDFAGMLQTRIQRLSFDESVDLARTVLGAGADRAVLRIVADLAAGDPGVLVGLRLTPAEANGEEPLSVPLRVREQRPHRRQQRECRVIDPRWAHVLDLLAVGPVYGLDRLRATAGEHDVDIDDLLDHGIVSVHGGLARIADPARRLRLHAGLSPEERRALHARGAADHAGAYPATRRWHESFLDPTADRSALLGGAILLARDAETAAAVEFAERALAGEMDEARRCELLVDLGEALVLGGHDLLGQHYLRRAGVSADPATRTRAAIARLRAVAAVDHTVDDTVLDHVDPLVGAEAAASERLLCESACLHLHRGEVDLAVERIALAVKLGVASTQTALLAGIAEEMGGRSHAAAAIRLEDDGDDVQIDHALLYAGLTLLREDYSTARRIIRAELDRSPRHAPMWREHLLRQLVTVEVRAGDPIAARDAVIAWQREWIPGRSTDAASTLILAAEAAMHEPPTAAADLVERGRERARREGASTLTPWFAAIEGSLALGEGRHTEAILHLRDARSLHADDDPAVMRLDADLIEALWLDGRHDEALEELQRLERAAADSTRRWTHLALARSRAVCRSAREGAAAFRDAETLFRGDDSPLERERLRRAEERCLPDVRVSAVRAIGGDAVPNPRPSLNARELTGHEREIVAFVERGLRNREIAAALFISLRTVELRLTGIYRKLGITSRVQLVAHLRGAAS